MRSYIFGVGSHATNYMRLVVLNLDCFKNEGGRKTGTDIQSYKKPFLYAVSTIFAIPEKMEN